nr:NADH dehydrogenase subunit 6 [Micranisa ralianga]
MSWNMMKPMIYIQIYLIIMIFMVHFLIFSFPTYPSKLHPLMLMLILLLLMILSSFLMNQFNNNHWFSYIMFLIMVGGMMIIFLYFTSFTSNMKMSLNWIYVTSLPIKFLMMMSFFIMYFKIMNIMLPWNNKYNEISSLVKYTKFDAINNCMFIYMYNKNYSMLISIIYLLICLTLIVKIMINKKLMLRKIS